MTDSTFNADAFSEGVSDLIDNVNVFVATVGNFVQAVGETVGSPELQDRLGELVTDAKDTAVFARDRFKSVFDSLQDDE